MTRDLQRSLQALDMMRQQQATIARVVALLNNSGVADAIHQMQRQQTSISRILALADGAARQSDLFRAAQTLHEVGARTSAALDSLNRVHPSWLSSKRNVAIPAVQLANVAQLALSDVSRLAATSRLLWSGIDYDALAGALKIQQSIMGNVQNSMSAFTASYCNLAESFKGIADVVTQPSFVLPGATQEVSTTGYALEVLHPLEDEAGTEDDHLELEGASENPDLIALLASVDMGLVDTYRGAVQALNGDNPDRSRHVLSSLRTLLDHLLRTLAPRRTVREWIEERGYHSYLDKGIPTRRAQILYMSKDVEAEPLKKFIEADTKTLEELYTLYNRLHELGTGISDSQLRAIVLRTESYIEYILRVREW